MSPDEMQRTMQFIVHQQAQFAAEMQLAAERAAANDRRWTDQMDALRVVVGQLAGSQIRTSEELRIGHAQLTSNIDRVEAHIERVEAHLNALIDTFERHLRDDHGRSS